MLWGRMHRPSSERLPIARGVSSRLRSKIPPQPDTVEQAIDQARSTGGPRGYGKHLLAALLAVAGMVATGCGDPSRTSDADRRPEPSADTVSLSEVSRMAELSGGQDPLYDIRDVLILTDDLVVASHRGQRRLVFFDSSGRVVRRSARSGEGPGEFSSPPYLFDAGGAFLAWTYGKPRRPAVFDEDGEFLSEIRLSFEGPHRVVGWLEGSGPVTVSLSPGAADSGTRLVVWQEDGAAPVDVLGPPDYPSGSYTSRRVTGGRTVPVVFTGWTGECVPDLYSTTVRTEMVVVDGGRAEVVVHGLDGRERVVYRSEARTPVDDALRASLRARLAERGAFPESRDSIEVLLDRVGLPGGSVPKWSGVVADPTGRLWLRRADCSGVAAARDARSSQWDIVSLEEGELLGTVAVPAHYRVRAARGTRLVVSRTDSLGIEYLELHRVPSFH